MLRDTRKPAITVLLVAHGELPEHDLPRGSSCCIRSAGQGAS
jgi:hypothetical protein